MTTSISVPSRGKAGESGSLDAKQKMDSYFRNQSSPTARLRRRKIEIFVDIRLDFLQI